MRNFSLPLPRISPTEVVMSPNLTTLLKSTGSKPEVACNPEFFRLSMAEDTQRLADLLSNNPTIAIINPINSILNETSKAEALQDTDRTDTSNFTDLNNFGCWVYYPWKSALIHLPDRELFIKLRTIRNKHKITAEEQNTLSNKKVGIVGLSVGQSVAIPLAMERICGTLRIADFDTLELTNTNRIKSSVLNIGLPKTTILAREISEIDPFIKVEQFNTAITEENIEAFILSNGKLDAIVDECDNLLSKLIIRQAAKKHRIPVIMDTSDNLFLDFERYDLDQNYPIFHGKVDLKLFEELDNPEKKIKLLFELIDFETLSERGKYSLTEIGRSITTWPQLATDVVAGGAISAKAIRTILLGDNELKGRIKLDLIQELKDRCKTS